MITAVLPIQEASQIADARRRAVERARSLSLDETLTGQLSIVVTELATNLMKFGRDGFLLIGSYEDGNGEGIQVLSLDRGPGIVGVSRALEDGFSTAGSAGKGLGAVRRLSHTFAIDSWLSGTAILARVGAGPPGRVAEPVWGSLEVPLKGEQSCGDAICLRRLSHGWTVLVADGLGHGPHAADASSEAVRQFRRAETEAPAVIVARIHEGLRHTRGAAIAVARYEEADGAISFAGIGNIAATIVGARQRQHLVSLAGTAGHNARKITTFDYPFPADSLLVMHSDGISGSWSLDAYPGLFTAHPGVIAGVLFRDHARPRDDASVIVVRATEAK